MQDDRVFGNHWLIEVYSLAQAKCSLTNDPKYFEFADEDISFVLSKRLWSMIEPLTSNSGTLVDIGCGVGTLLFNLQEANFDATIVGHKSEWTTLLTSPWALS